MNQEPDQATRDVSDASPRRRSVRIARSGADEGGAAPVEQAGRRGFLRLAAAAAVGATAAALAESGTAAAATGLPLLIGQSNSPTVVGDVTEIATPSSTDLMPTAFRVENYTINRISYDSAHRIAIFGRSSDQDAGGGLRVGVAGYADPATDTNKKGVGVWGESNVSVIATQPSVPVGVFGVVSPDAAGDGHAVSARATGTATGVAATSVDGIGVRALSTNGIGIVATGSGNAINATSVGSGVGISATGVNGVVGTANSAGDGVSGVSTSGRGVLATSTSGDGVRGVSSSGRAMVARSTSNTAVSAESTSGLDLDCNGTGRVRVKPQSAVGAPVAGTYAAGELILDSAGDLFACVVAGTPGTWHRVGSTTTSPATGVFRPVDPFRAYDSRQAAYPVNGALTLGANRVVSVKDAHSPTGAVTATDVVPAGATAITLNLTIVTPTSPAGFLAVTPGDATSFVSSSINWSSAGVVLANGGVAKLDGARQLKVFAGGGTGAVDFVVDVTGYYL
jgi:hypothetical protein